MQGRTHEHVRTESAFLLSVLVVLLLESIDTPGSVHKTLLASVEGMTHGTNLHVHLILCRHRFEAFPACADNLGRYVIGMNPLLHTLLQQFGQAIGVKAKRATYGGLVSTRVCLPIVRA